MQFSEITNELKEQIIKYYLMPKTANDVVRFFNISLYLLHRILDEANIPKHSKELADKLGKEHLWANNLKKYGVRSPFALKEVHEKVKQTSIERYGVDNPAKLEETKEKCKQTCQKRYGVDAPMQIKEVMKKSEKTKLEKYGDPHFVNHEKAEQTFIQKYGVNSYAKTDEFKEKMHQIGLEKYGADYPICSKEVIDKTRQTNLERYGQDTFAGSDAFQQKLKEVLNDKYGVDCIWQIPGVKEKGIATCQERYGVDYYQQTEEFKNRLKEIDPIRVEKIFETKKKNGTITTSNIEQDFYNKLLNIFKKDDIFRQYIEDRYPFHCDFYIKSLDLFIELNLTWTHGGKLFENSEEDKIKLNKWLEKAKTSKYYQDAIKTWTERDVKKFEVAKKNNLKYLVIYSAKELKNFDFSSLWNKA